MFACFLLFLCRCSSLAVWIAFFADFCTCLPPNGVPLEVVFRIFCRFGRKKRVLKLRLQKRLLLGSNLQGPAAGGGVCGTCIYAETATQIQHALLPLRGCGEY